MIGKFLLCFTLLVLPSLAEEKAGKLSYASLRKSGVVSGFGIRHGDPLGLKGRIPAIDHPIYVESKKGLYPEDLLCIGMQVEGEWRFSPLETLNSHEVINHQGKGALCFCPLAGLSIALDGDMIVSGLLRYDTFLLVANKTDELIVPFLQRTYRHNRAVRMRDIHMLEFSGIAEHFPGARILDPEAHSRTQPYGAYPTDSNPGIGHPRPGLKWHYSRRQYGHHPKEFVLIAGRKGKIEKAYPLAELKKSVPKEGGSFGDEIDGEPVTVHFSPISRWGRVTNIKGASLNVGYAYIFAFVQNLPNLPVYRKAGADPKQKTAFEPAR